MKRLAFLFFLILIFLSQCAQNVGIMIDSEYDPEVKIVAGKNYPEIRSIEVIQALEVNGKIYPITQKDRHEIVKIPVKYLKNPNKYTLKAGLNDLWQFTYSEADKTLEAVPRHYSVTLDLLRQNPRQYDKNRPFIREDLAAVEIYYMDKVLENNRFLANNGRPDLLDLKIPVFPEVRMDDYRIKINLPGYEPFDRKLIDIQEKTIRLRLQQEMLKLKFVNLENSTYEPGFVILQNSISKEEKYSSDELKEGISIYSIEFPVKIYSQQKSITLFDDRGQEMDTLIIDKAGFYNLVYKENFREFPVVFYDISKGKTEPDMMERWLNEKKNSSEGIFIFASNGDEKIFNSNPNNIINVTNQIYRIAPRTSNVLDNIREFIGKFKNFTSQTNLDNEETFGTKLAPRYYIFLSDDNVERLEFAVEKFTRQLQDLEIKSTDVIVCINESQKKSAVIRQLKESNFNVQTL
ncbi:MAG: hypothetical protein JXQ65_05205 [Candidatus Marinimicrobia bacterium]|nr:hypothetical protein [Candidatus Neomarinimicrobiota bacterium]